MCGGGWWWLRDGLFHVIMVFMTTVTLNLPDETLNQAKQAADLLARPVEDILSELLTAVVPSLQDAPSTVQAELIQMTWWSTEKLWKVARGQMSNALQEEMQQLIQSQDVDEAALSVKDAARLEELRYEYGRMTLLKARAYAILSVRGGEPLLTP